MSPNEVLVGCENDKRLVVCLVGAGRTITHHSGRTAIATALQARNEPAYAVVDADPDSIPSSYLTSLKSRCYKRLELTVLTDEARQHVVVTLNPRLEEWLLQTARQAGVDPEEFDLGRTPAQFKKGASVMTIKFNQCLAEAAGE